MIRNKVKAKLRFHLTLIWVGSLRVSSVFSFCKIKGYCEWKYRFYRYASGIRLPDCSKLTVNWKNGNDFIIFWHDVNVVLFLLTSIATGPGFMLISSLVVELWQFLFIRDWPETQKSEITPSGFGSISGDCCKQAIPNLARTSLIKCYWMMQNARVTAFTVSELLRKNRLEGGGGTNPHAPQIKVKCWRGVILNSRVPCKLHIKLKGCYILKSKDSAVFTWLLKKVLFKTFIQNLVINNEG